MIDIESLGTYVDSQVMSIGACVFDEDSIDGSFYQVIGLPDNEHVKATASTIQFWIQQGAQAIDELFYTHTEREDVVMADLQEWLECVAGGNELIVWANGTKFDIASMEESFRRFDLTIPWKYNADRCMRTLKSLAGELDIPDNKMVHNALHDAMWQANYVVAAHKKLGIPLEK